MKSVADYVALLESEGAVNNVSDGNVALREVPLTKNVVKRKPIAGAAESAAYQGENPLKDNIGKMPLVGDEKPDSQKQHNPLADNIGKAPLTGVQAPEIDDGKSNGHMFKQKQKHQKDQMISGSTGEY